MGDNRQSREVRVLTNTLLVLVFSWDFWTIYSITVVDIQCIQYMQYMQYIQCIQYMQYMQYIQYIQYIQYALSPVVRSLQLCSHLAVVVTRVFLYGCRGYRELTEQVNQPGEASNATECWETKVRLQSSTLNELQCTHIITFTYRRLKWWTFWLKLCHSNHRYLHSRLSPVKWREPSCRTFPSTSLFSPL